LQKTLKNLDETHNYASILEPILATSAAELGEVCGERFFENSNISLEVSQISRPEP